MVNIMPFGMCTQPREPDRRGGDGGRARRPHADALHPEHHGAVGARRADRAARQQPALDDTSKLNCMWGGVIKVNFAGQVTEQIP